MFALSLWLASAGVVQKYAGTTAAVGYLPVCVGFAVLTPMVIRRGRDVSFGPAVAGLAALALVTVVAIVVVFPHANSHAPNTGSDRDDAATLAASRLVDGQNPYTERTYLGGAISQFPGGVIAAVPFVKLFGSAGYELVVWIPILALLLAFVGRSAGAAAALLLIVLAISPGVWREILTGGDLIPCVTAVCFCLIAIERSWAWPLLGVALCWRPNLAISAIPFLMRLRPPRAIAAVLISAATFSLLTIPFVAWGGFTPWTTSNKLESYDGVVPGGARTLVLLGVAVAVVLVWRDIGTVWTQAAAPQAFYLGAIVVKASLDAHRLELLPLVSGYGVLVLIPAMFGLLSDEGRPDTIGRDRDQQAPRLAKLAT